MIFAKHLSWCFQPHLEMQLSGFEPRKRTPTEEFIHEVLLQHTPTLSLSLTCDVPPSIQWVTHQVCTSYLTSGTYWTKVNNKTTQRNKGQDFKRKQNYQNVKSRQRWPQAHKAVTTFSKSNNRILYFSRLEFFSFMETNPGDKKPENRAQTCTLSSYYHCRGCFNLERCEKYNTSVNSDCWSVKDVCVVYILSAPHIKIF